ncbi:isocitrate lyase/PEP mutase family protein, partial [Sporomusa sp.]|uniref:isocitrate lyase/PEP mutase family protein n=1 Tax=Sporomusa sp. TaxID=2078658 RepID=UPI002BFFC6E2
MSKAKLLKESMKKGRVIAPFVYDGVQARFVERNGFEACYMTGFGTASKLGIPDVGLLTLTEMAENVRIIANSVGIPVVADADTGYGNYSNVVRTVREYEKAGAAALHLEDQLWPKRCGYMTNKQVIPKDEAVSKVKAALDARHDQDFIIIARTDALAVEGWDSVEERARAFVEVGADMIFVDGIHEENLAEYKRRLGDLPIMLNNVPHIPMKKVDAVGGFRLVIHPGAFSASFKTFDEELQLLKNTGVVSLDKPFEVFNRLVDILGAEEYFKLDSYY